MHSPWGLKFQIFKDTNLTWHEAMWKVPRATILLMMADRSNFKNVKETAKEESGKDLLARRGKK